MEEQKKKMRIKSKYLAGYQGAYTYRSFASWEDWRDWENIFDRINYYGGMRHQAEFTDEMFHKMGKKVIYTPISQNDFKEITHYDEYDSYFLYPGSK